MKRLFITVILLTLLSGLTAYAADSWVFEGDGWYCYDSGGNKVMGRWRTSGGSQYYLDDETGIMVTDSVVRCDDGIYYCDENGAKAMNCWKKVTVGDGYEHMYFGSSGRAYTCQDPSDPDKTIDGKKYRFNEEGYMLYGFLDSEDNRVVYPSEADRYYGTRDDGAGVTDWVNVRDGGDYGCGGIYMAKSSVWFYFENGRKVRNVTEKSIGESRYGFDENGAMITGWHAIAGEGSLISRVRYYGDVDDGKIKKSTWVDADDYDADIPVKRRYYLNSQGVPFHAENGHCIYKIDGNYYCFDATGKMLSGLVKGTTSDYTDVTAFVMEAPIEYATLTELTLNEGETVLYFSQDDEQKGQLCTGLIDEELDDRLYLDRHGNVLDGFIKGKIYNAGILQVPDEGPHGLVLLNRESDRINNISYYMADTAGHVIKNEIVKDKDKYYWYVDKDYASYKVVGNTEGSRAYSNYEQLVAQALKKGEKTFSPDYELITTPMVDDEGSFMCYTVKWKYIYD